MKWIKIKRNKGEMTEATKNKMIDNLPILVAYSFPKFPCEKTGIKYEIIYDFSELLDYKVFYDVTVIKFVAIK